MRFRRSLQFLRLVTRDNMSETRLAAISEIERDVMKDPALCPFCAGSLLQELEPSELELDDTVWIIYHWQCLECEDTFDKIVETDMFDEFEDEYEDEEGGQAQSH